MTIVWNKAPFKLKTQMFNLFSGDTILEASRKGEPIDLNNEIDNIQGLLSLENGRQVSMDETITFLLHNKDKFVRDDSNSHFFKPVEEAPDPVNGGMHAPFAETRTASQIQDPEDILSAILGQFFGFGEEERFTLHKHAGDIKMYAKENGELTAVEANAKRFTESELEDFQSEGWHVETVA